MSTTTINLQTLTTERDKVLTEARDLAAKAESAGRGFTDAEQVNVASLLAKAKAYNADIKRLKAVGAVSGDIDALMSDGQPAPGTKGAIPFQRGTEDRGPKQARFAKAIGSALFGSTGIDANTSGLTPQNRTFFDGTGLDAPDPKAITALNVRSGRTSIPVGRTQTGGDIVLLPEFGGTLLGLLSKPELTGGDIYRVRRQTTRDEDAAKFVPKRAAKPEAAFGYEVIDDRVRTLAVLSDPIPVQDLADVPSLKDDVANELANRIIWKLEDAIVRGEQTDLDDAGREMFDGILNTTGVRSQPYLVSPYRTIRRSLTLLEAAGYDPEALSIGLNPLTWETLETEVDENGRPLFSGLYTARQEPVLFGRPVVLSNRLAEGESIVADWRHGAATLRSDIELSWSDGGDLFETNTVRFRADLRAGFNLTQPGAFVHAALEAGSGDDEDEPTTP